MCFTFTGRDDVILHFLSVDTVYFCVSTVFCMRTCDIQTPDDTLSGVEEGQTLSD